MGELNQLTIHCLCFSVLLEGGVQSSHRLCWIIFMGVGGCFFLGGGGGGGPPRGGGPGRGAACGAWCLPVPSAVSIRQPLSQRVGRNIFSLLWSLLDTTNHFVRQQTWRFTCIPEILSDTCFVRVFRIKPPVCTPMSPASLLGKVLVFWECNLWDRTNTSRLLNPYPSKAWNSVS
jgi:hypothetical protein